MVVMQNQKMEVRWERLNVQWEEKVSFSLSWVCGEKSTYFCSREELHCWKSVAVVLNSSEDTELPQIVKLSELEIELD
jgi:hypothetical protein